MQKRKRSPILAISATVLIAILTVVAVAVAMYYPAIARDEKDYEAVIAAQTVFDNASEDAFPQTVSYNLIKNHFENNTSGKTPMLLFVGYDGCRAEMPELNINNPGSAIGKVASQGGLYYTYAGGVEKGGQKTSTAPGWATIFTGVWAPDHGVFGNSDVLNEDTRSIFYRFGEQGLASSYSVSWGTHINKTYKKEITSAAANKYPITYTLSDDDDGTYQTMLSRIAAGDRAVFGIFEYTDHTGHTSGFGKKNPKYLDAFLTAEEKAYSLISAVEARETYDSEDWLIIITSDHGGYHMNHGGVTLMERLTFVAVNKQGLI